MSRTNKKPLPAYRNPVALEMHLERKVTLVMRDRRKRRPKDARHSPFREEW